MFGPTSKLRTTTRDPIDQVPLYWNAHPDGLPIREGDSPVAIEKQLRNQASHILFARSIVLEIPKEIQKYVEIVDWIANGGGVLRFEERRPDPEDATKWHVWMTWLDVRGVIPTKPEGPG